LEVDRDDRLRRSLQIWIIESGAGHAEKIEERRGGRRAALRRIGALRAVDDHIERFSRRIGQGERLVPCGKAKIQMVPACRVVAVGQEDGHSIRRSIGQRRNHMPARLAIQIVGQRQSGQRHGQRRRVVQLNKVVLEEAVRLREPFIEDNARRIAQPGGDVRGAERRLAQRPCAVDFPRHRHVGDLVSEDNLVRRR
jgi:hypothetical protein